MGTGRNTKLGIGFATGRKSFQQVLKTYVYNWYESGLTKRESVDLHLLVAYDLKYNNTKVSDYTDIRKDLLDFIDTTCFIGGAAMQKEIASLTGEDVVDEREARMLFGKGYAAKRNAVLYTALKNGIDYLVFLDDDEYPVAVTKTRDTAIWSGQHVLLTHLKHIARADITNGHHCGYISPIPYIRFNDTMTEGDFRTFIEAISNDIINWDTIRTVMKNGGVTYADTGVLTGNTAEEVEETEGTKFISGANLCINLTRPERVLPFYNPPGARGEDTFLSTCLTGRRVVRVPCYTFHDGFSTYNHLMDGVLPIALKYIQADSDRIVNRFYRACIGWIRYKPLLLYITKRQQYGERIAEMRGQLAVTLPKVCAYFRKAEFMNVLKELDTYDEQVQTHYQQFMETQRIWKKVCGYFPRDVHLHDTQSA